MTSRLKLLTAASTVVLAAIAWAVAAQVPPETPRAVGRPLANSKPTVHDFGAKGDGLSDDTAAIQRAVNASAGRIEFPPGTYLLTKTIEVPLKETGWCSFVGSSTARLVMKGQGPALRLRGTHAGTAAPESVQPGVWERERTPTLRGLEIVGGHPEADGVEASGTMQLTITDCSFRGLRHAVHLVERNRNVLISDCHIYHNRGIGVFLDNVDLHQTNITGSHISYNGGGGVVVREGNVRNVHITGCDIEANMAADGPATANVLLECGSGSVAEVAITGCTIQHSAKAPDSANIRVLGEGQAQIGGKLTKVNCGHITIANNVFSDVQTNVHLRGARGVALVGNTFWQGYAYNLLVEDCQQVVVSANVMERNPLYGYTAESDNGVLFDRSRDCTLNGLHLHHVQKSEAGLILRKCDRMHVAGCSLLDCETAGLLLEETTNSRISDCLVRDDREAGEPSVSIRIAGGSGNTLSSCTVDTPPRIDASSAVSQDVIVLSPDKNRQ